MKVKTASLLAKALIACTAFGLCILKWASILPNATISEIWQSAAWCYGILLGTVDFNICRDNWVESKKCDEMQ